MRCRGAAHWLAFYKTENNTNCHHVLNGLSVACCTGVAPYRTSWYAHAYKKHWICKPHASGASFRGKYHYVFRATAAFAHHCPALFRHSCFAKQCMAFSKLAFCKSRNNNALSGGLDRIKDLDEKVRFLLESMLWFFKVRVFTKQKRRYAPTVSQAGQNSKGVTSQG